MSVVHLYYWGSRRRTTPVYDARYQGTVTVHYNLHRLLGKEGKVVRKVCYGRAVFLELDVDGRRHAVPEWMTDALHCQALIWGDDPCCSWETLQAVLTLLEQV